MVKFLAVFLITAFFTLQASASEIIENFINARALGMGNAYSAVVDDYTALWYNPAGLNKIHGFHLVLLGLNIATDAEDAYQIYQSTNGNNWSAIIDKYFGQNIYIGIEDAAAVSTKDFALAAYNYFDADFILHNPAYPNLSLTLNNDIGITSGFAAPLLPNDALVLGFAVKRITRYGGQVELGPSLLANFSNTEITNLINSYGTGYGMNFGMLMTLPGPLHPTFSAVWNDAGQTTFQTTTGTTSLAPIDNDAIAGFSMRIDVPFLTITPAFDFTHINMVNEDIGKRIQLGTEFQFPGLAIRGGANQGYYTAGVGLNLSYLKIDAATYGVELDTYPGQLEDRRYIVQITIDLNADLSIGRSDGADQGPNSGVIRNFQRR